MPLSKWQVYHIEKMIDPFKMAANVYISQQSKENQRKPDSIRACADLSV
jgi:Tfp pilus assembly protein PilP